MSSRRDVATSDTGGDFTSETLICGEARFSSHFEAELYTLMGRFVEKPKHLSLDIVFGIF